MKKLKSRLTTLIGRLKGCMQPTYVFEALKNDHLAKILRHELNRRGLWHAPPAWLGYDGETWDDSFEDLLIDCYIFSICKRIRGLRSHLKTGKPLDPLIFQNVEWFVTDCQKRFDPIGYAVWQNVMGAVEHAIKSGKLTATGLDKKGKICNATLLTCLASTILSEKSLNKILCKNKEWLNIRLKLVWNDKRVYGKLGDVVCDLGLNEVKFKDLVDVMKKEVRQTWQACYTAEALENTAIEDFEDDTNQIVKIIGPDTAHEDYQSWINLIKQIMRAIDELDVDPELCQRIRECFFEMVVYIIREEKAPSQNELARLLVHSTSTINKYTKKLRQIVLRISE